MIVFKNRNLEDKLKCVENNKEKKESSKNEEIEMEIEWNIRKENDVTPKKKKKTLVN